MRWIHNIVVTCARSVVANQRSLRFDATDRDAFLAVADSLVDGPIAAEAQRSIRAKEYGCKDTCVFIRAYLSDGSVNLF